MRNVYENTFKKSNQWNLARKFKPLHANQESHNVAFFVLLFYNIHTLIKALLEIQWILLILLDYPYT